MKRQQQQAQHSRDAAKRPKPAPIKFGPYLSDRQWATIREDLSTTGCCWESCDFRRSHRDPYIAGEDGLLGISDERCRICFAWGLWNGHDPFVKEKLFGVTGGSQPQGNHGEDVKEVYFYQLNSPDHGYMRAKYMYPSGCGFPYEELLRGNATRSTGDDEFEICDTDAFSLGFWEVKVEYARLPDSEDGDTVCLLTARNCGDTERTLHVLPTLWFRNTWSTEYSEPHKIGSKKPSLPKIERVAGDSAAVECRHPALPDVFVQFNASTSAEPSSQVLFTRNEAGEKDAVSRYLLRKQDESPLPSLPDTGGTKCCSVHLLTAAPGAEKRVVVRIASRYHRRPPTGDDDAVPTAVAKQRDAAAAFYAGVLDWLPAGEREVAEICQLAYSGLLWSKQYYEYRVAEFQRRRQLTGRHGDAFKWNPSGWEHLDNADIMSMPDKWEFPWYASWDSSFHAAVLVDIDPEFAKNQIELLLSDRFMSPEGQVPGCEFNYSDENPPVLAWAAHEIWLATGDVEFGRRVYPRLKLNFNWWLQHRRVGGVDAGGSGGKDADGIYFKSGFLGMDNICAFDRSRVPDGCRVYQADAFAWVFSTALHCLQLALATRQSREEVAFWLDWLARLQRGFRHLDAEGDGFCYDILEQQRPDGASWARQFVRIKSMVGLMPLTAVLTFDWDQLVTPHATEVARSGIRVERGSGGSDRRLALVSLLDRDQWMRVFGHLFPPGDGASQEQEGFLGPFGVRMVSRWHREHPVTLHLGGSDWTLNYEPGESRTSMYGGNSNWRGPVWLCMNYLLAQAALRIHTGGRPKPELRRFARLVCERVLGIFRAGPQGRRPVHGDCKLFADGGPWSSAEFTLFYEYFHGDTGRGCGASHQTGWTALVVKFAEMLYTRLTAA